MLPIWMLAQRHMLPIWSLLAHQPGALLLASRMERVMERAMRRPEWHADTVGTAAAAAAAAVALWLATFVRCSSH